MTRGSSEKPGTNWWYINRHGGPDAMRGVGGGKMTSDSHRVSRGGIGTRDMLMNERVAAVLRSLEMRFLATFGISTG